MADVSRERLCQEIVAKAKTFGADLAGIASVVDLKRSPSPRIIEKMPDFDGVGTKSVAGRRRGVVQWPEGAQSAIVIAVEHAPERPELDWWVTGASDGNTAGNRLLMAVFQPLSGRKRMNRN